MLFGKKKIEVKPHQKEEIKEESFIIPQIEDDTLGLRINKPQFTKTQALSPMRGTQTKDVLNIPSADNHQDIDLAYDAFRVEKKLTEEDEIRRYGRKYHEFESVDSKFTDDVDVPKKPLETVKNPSEVGLNFDFIVAEDEIDKDLAPKEVKTNPTIISFGEEKKETDDVPFSYVDLSNEIKDEAEEDYVRRPTGRVPSFLQPDYPKVDESMPKTIITHNVRETPVDDYADIRIEDSKPQASQPFKEPFKEEPRVFEAPTFEHNNVSRLEELKEAPKTVTPNKYLDYVYPPYSLLDPISAASKEVPGWLEEKKEIINNTLRDFGVDGDVVNYTHGPSVTRYEVKLASGVNVKKISQIEDNLKMSLSVRTIRIEAPIPGKSNVGIEIPNEKTRTVGFAEIVDRPEFKEVKKPLYIALGLDIDGNPVYNNIASMPHGLIAGGTGSGKSVCVNGLLVSLIMRNSPEKLRLILVDPKQVELINYQDLPHLATPVITDPEMASEALKWACEEMDRRYRSFPAVRARDLESYNSRIANDPSLKPLPYLVIVIDELADLMMTCGNDVEASIQRIVQMGRACGIHLIVATQRPTTDIVRGAIKTNIQTRIAFRVSSFVDSNTILGQAGAETLLGRGDMLIKDTGQPTRVQGAYITDDEIARITDFIRDHYKPDYIFTHEELIQKTKAQYGASETTNEDPELLYAIASSMIERGMCSINNIQNTFSLGFNRAQAIVNTLEEMGIVSAKKGTTGREILVTQAEVDQMFKKGA